MTADNETTMTTHFGPQALLIVKQGPQIGIQFPLTAERYTIGREESCDIIIQDAEVSRRHSLISWTEHGFVIQDLESTNGTFLNGSQLNSATPLKSGDNIGLGQTTLMFELLQAAQPAFGYGSSAQESEQNGGKPGATSSFSGMGQRRLLVGCGCLLLLLVCGITVPTILQMAGIVDLIAIGQGLGF